MAVRGGCWFALGDRQLHLGAETDFRPAKKAHVALALEGLDALRARIEAAGHATHDDSIIDGRHRFFTEDPFGNRIEFMDRTARSEEHTSELQSLMRISYAVFCLKKQKILTPTTTSSCRFTNTTR